MQVCPASNVLQNYQGDLAAYQRLLIKLLRETWHAGRSLGPDVIHYVGTGWDFCGFAILKWASQVGARFSVLPAIHPKLWGDDVLDIRLYQQASAVICLSESRREP
jgi:hypothetical protein